MDFAPPGDVAGGGGAGQNGSAAAWTGGSAAASGMFFYSACLYFAVFPVGDRVSPSTRRSH